MRQHNKDNSKQPALTQNAAVLETGKKLGVAVSAKIQRGWELSQQIKVLQDELNAIKADLKAHYPDGVNASITGMCVFKICERSTTTIKPGAINLLQSMLKDRFDDLVKSTHKPTEKLLLEAAHNERIKHSLVTEVNYSATWRKA